MHPVTRRSALALGAGAVIVATVPVARAQAARIDIGVPVDTTNNLPLMLASALGFFRDEGIDARVVNAGGGGNLRQIVAAGQMPYAMGDVAHPLAMTGAGKPAKVLLAVDTRATVANVMVRTAHWDAGVRSLEALGALRKPDGTKPQIGVTRIGSATWLYGTFLLERAGVLDNVNFVSIADGAPMLAAFRTGRIDALVANPVTYFAVLDEKMGVPVFDTTDKAAWDKAFGSRVPSQCLFALDSQIKAEPRLTQGVVNAVWRGLKYIETRTPAELFAAIEGKFMTELKPEATIRELGFMKPIFDFDARVTPETYANGAKIWFSESTKIAPQPYETMIDLSFLEAARRKFN